MSSRPDSGQNPGQTSGTKRKATFPERCPLFYYITDRHSLSLPTEAALSRVARKILVQGVDCIQVREKDLSDRRLFGLTCRIVEMAREAARDTPCKVIVNGRADIALAAGADGVHLPSSGLPVASIRAWTPKDFIVGVSVHSLREIRAACEGQVDYILVGHVFPTASKEGMGPALGLGFLRRAVAHAAMSSVPVLALGGVTPECIPSVLATGAAGIAGISLFQKGAYPSVPHKSIYEDKCR